MLTDIFAARYESRPIWSAVNDPERVLVIRAWRIISDQLIPLGKDGGADGQHRATWETVERNLSMELGLESLYPRYFSSREAKVALGPLKPEAMCRVWMLEPYKGGEQTPDRYMKERMSFVELAFRERKRKVDADNVSHSQSLKTTIPKETSDLAPSVSSAISNLNEFSVSLMSSFNRKMNQTFDECCYELNERFKQAKAPLNYHNGFIQIESDTLIQRQISAPFWSLTADPKWKNVEHDMVEAVDRREANERDPAFYAMRALESAIKIVSDLKGWTRGTETGASQYLDNLQAKVNGQFIQPWEAAALRQLFKEVRNPLGHGPGATQMPSLTIAQTDWVIESCMSWIRSLVRRM